MLFRSFDAGAGEQRVGRVFDEEVVWVDIYDNPDNCMDIEVLEDRLYEVPECGLLSNRQHLLAAPDVQPMLEGEA